MTDSNHASQSPSTSSPPGYEGTDPDLPDRKKESSRSAISTVQVGASAAAAVTSALAASFFGVAGTLIGAAIGSIVSTIAGALYADYLGRAGERIKVTRNVVIQRIPSEVLTTTPLRHLTSPTDLPGRDSLRPIGDETSDETVAVPVEEAGELLQHPDGLAPLDPTTVLPAYGSTAAETALQGAQGSGRNAPGNGANGTGANRTGPSGAVRTDPGRPSGEPTRPFWKRPVLAMSAVSVVGFLIALGVVVGTELVIGRPVSGGTSGTTLSNLGNTGSTSETKVTPTETPASTPSATATESPSAEATTEAPVVPSASADPTATGGTETVPTDQPTAESTDPGVAPTDPGLGGAAEATDAP
jgi:hypothetical protein